MTYEECISYILDIPKFTSKNDLNHTRYFLDLLGNPDRKMKVIHVAGTNGKGSVCSCIQSILQCAGKTTGLFTSPHLVKINERFRINGEAISDLCFLQGFLTVYKLVEQAKEKGIPHPTFFEFLFLMAMVIFKDCEYVILETGLGGRLDATNVVASPMLTVITSISLDHTELLGDTIEKIAGEKAGIIKPGVPVVFYDKCKASTDVIKQTAKRNQSKYSIVSKKDIKNLCIRQKSVDFSTYVKYYSANGVISETEEIFHVSFPAPYQAENAALALRAVEYLDCAPELSAELRKNGVECMRWEGRMEEIIPGIIVDGAHNEDGMEAFIQAASANKNKKYLVFTAVKEKDYEHMIARLCRELSFSKIYVTQLPMERGTPAEKLQNIFQKYTDSFVEVETNPEKAFLQAKENKEKDATLYCVGSLYLVGMVKSILIQ